LGRRWKALVLALIPGFGHFYLGRQWRGLFVFGLFALAVNGMYLAVGMGQGFGNVGEHVFVLCRGAAVAVWAYSLLHVAHLVRRFETRALIERKDYHFKRGLVQYLAGSFGTAEAEFRAVLKLDPTDADARFHLGMTCAALGRPRDAAKAFRRCLADDPAAKWEWEVKGQIEKLKRSG